uniref:Uncharacterized protein n=1 Tax=Timema cristinae TaxID=61476 RepID=A0A7R9CYF1_TIMCR|nr:unnamed protein product [Timema cristinae]
MSDADGVMGNHDYLRKLSYDFDSLSKTMHNNVPRLPGDQIVVYTIISFSASVEPDEDISSDLSEQIQSYLDSEFSDTSTTTLAAAIETYLKEAVANVNPDDYVY